MDKFNLKNIYNAFTDPTNKKDFEHLFSWLPRKDFWLSINYRCIYDYTDKKRRKDKYELNVNLI